MNISSISHTMNITSTDGQNLRIKMVGWYLSREPSHQTTRKRPLVALISTDVCAHTLGKSLLKAKDVDDAPLVMRGPLYWHVYYIILEVILYIFHYVLYNSNHYFLVFMKYVRA